MALSAAFIGVDGYTGTAVAAAAPAPLEQSSFPAGAPDFRALVRSVKPAVVNISTTQKISQRRMPPGRMPFPPGSPGEEFFRRFFEDQAERGGRPAKPQEAHSLGSGFIIDPSGWVVTNNHVVERADEITVTLQDGTELPATIRGRDPKTDVAVLKVESDRPLPHVNFGNSDSVEDGEWVLAVGNPFGLGGTVTAGIVSARGRNIGSGPYDDFLQTDASINRGNSGGPMFNTQGQVIGINTAIFSPNGGSIGIGFAVPSNLAKPVIDQLIATGKVERGWLGVQLQGVNEALAGALGLDEPRGALVAQVTPDSPAAKAGLRVGDLIVGYAGKDVKDVRDLPRAVADTKPGAKETLRVLRDGREESLTVAVEAMPESKTLADASTSSEAPEGRLGLALAPLTDDARRGLDLPAGQSGVLVADVEADSEAAKKGLSAGDVIVSVDRGEVRSPEDVARAVQKARDGGRKTLLFLVKRGEANRFVPLDLA